MTRQSSFASGEIDPKLHARSEMNQYANGLALCRNVIVTPHGALVPRPGFLHKARFTSVNGPPRLIPFSVADGEYYLLALVPRVPDVAFQLTCYVYYKGALVTSFNLTSCVDNYEELATLEYAQQGDVMTFTGPGVCPFELKRSTLSGTEVWSYETLTFVKNRVTGVPETPRCAAGFQFNQKDSDAYPTNEWEWVITYWMDGVELVHSFCLTAGSSAGNYGDAADRQCVVSPDKTAVTLTGSTCYAGASDAMITAQRVSVYRGRDGVWGLLGDATLAGNQWTYEDRGADPDYSITPPSRKYPPYKVRSWAARTRVEKGEILYTPGGLYYQVMAGGVTGGTAPTGTGTSVVDGCATQWVSGTTYSAGQYVISYGDTYLLVTAGSGNTAMPAPYIQRWGTAYQGADVFSWTSNNAHSADGYYWQFVGKGGAAVLKYLGSALGDMYPNTVAYYNQRRIFGGCEQYGERLMCSNTGNYYTYDVNQSTTQDSDAIDLYLATDEREQIVALAAARGLLVLTDRGVWSLTGDSTDGFTAKTVTAIKHVHIGSAQLHPIIIGHTLLYVTATQNDIQAVDYQYYLQTYESQSITQLSRHLFLDNAGDRKIVAWTYQRIPYGIVWCVRADGKMVGITFDKDQKLAGFHWHDTPGASGKDVILDACAVNEGTESVLYVITKRYIDGAWTYNLERMANPVLPTADSTSSDPTEQTVDPRQCVFLDSATTYASSSTAVTSLTASNLILAEVSVLADGNVLEETYTASSAGLVDFSGELVDGANYVVVGLPYTMQVKTLPAVDPRTDVRSNIKDVKRVALELLDTLGLAMGPSFDVMRERTDRKVSDSWDCPTPFSGLDHLRVAGKLGHDAAICIQQKVPWPFTILAISREEDVLGD